MSSILILKMSVFLYETPIQCVPRRQTSIDLRQTTDKQVLKIWYNPLKYFQCHTFSYTESKYTNFILNGTIQYGANE